MPKSKGKWYIQIGDKIVITSGTYSEPIAEYVIEFDSVEKADEFIERLQ